VVKDSPVRSSACQAEANAGSTPNEIGQHPTDDVGAEASASQRSGDPTLLDFPRQIRQAAQLLAGQRPSRSQLVFAIDVLERKVDELASHAFGLKLVP
jgi:hypothetical protein